ncbi:FMN-binding negative transcriptional regulator [Tistrella bauzanensis]|uniref:FMN-binding negative transcriptional regulator n=1 Tax=Tistrella TaxID=171436 RepID=UPI0031F6392E
MYSPPAYRADDPVFLRALMREWSFATLVSHLDGETLITHLPVLVDEGGTGLGVLSMHMARANPHWRHFEAGAEAVVIFSGPHAYVSVNWYEGKQTFPTWNYGAIHARGPVTLEHDPLALRDLLARTIATYDAPLGGAWRFADVDEDKVVPRLGGIVGLRVAIARLDGKLKFNQDKPAADRARVRHALMQHPATADAARFMTRLESGGS